MDHRFALVWIYLFICERSGHIEALPQRQSNNSRPDFTDEEVLTVYLFGLFRKRRSVSGIYQYARDHFAEWFPDLPSYQAYNRRLNRMSGVFAPLVEEALALRSLWLRRDPQRSHAHCRFDADHARKTEAIFPREGCRPTGQQRLLLFGCMSSPNAGKGKCRCQNASG